MSEEVEVTDEQIEYAQRIYLSEIMRQLTESDRFNRFFEVNYEVQTHIDEENNTYNIRLIERPPELAAAKLEQMLVESGKDAPLISTATDAEIAALKKDWND